MNKIIEQDLREKIISTATKFIGYSESNGTHKKIIDIYNANVRGYKMTYVDPWCACFASIVSILADMTDIMPVEISCNQMINKYKLLGQWEENDAFTPKHGDIIFYDWEDNGIGDNTGQADHVGIVISTISDIIKVIEGNISKSVGYRSIKVNGKYIRGYGLPDYAGKANKMNNNSSNIISADIKVGDIVHFFGGDVYKSSNSEYSTYAGPPSECKIIDIYHKGKHQYHIMSAYQGFIHGWIDATSITLLPKN